jgi:CRP/FNR family transcriptional regulator
MDVGAVWRSGEFYKTLSPAAMSEFESLAAPFRCEEGTVLLSEGEQSSRVLFLLDGRVRLSINSTGGKRLVLGIAEPGDILGVAAAVSGAPSEITAEAQFRCSIASLPRQGFLDFLLRYPIASYSIGRQLGAEYKRACEELRMVGFSVTASIKLARLLVEWCARGIETQGGVHIQCSLTNEEIGEYIGVSRETVSRTLTDFKNRELVQQHGSTMFVTSLRALELYAGRVSR